MPTRPCPTPSRSSRRRLLLGAALAPLCPLSACGGGGADDAPTPAPPAATPTGRLVYRSSTGVGVFDFARAQEASFEPSSRPFLDPGVGLSPDGLVSVALEGGGEVDFRLGFHALGGAVQRVLEVRRPLSFQTGAVVWNARDDRFALSVDEPVSAQDGTRLARTLVVRWPAAVVEAVFDHRDAPAWAGDDLLLREAGSERVRRHDAALQDLGRLEAPRVATPAGSFGASRDARMLVWTDAADPRQVMALDLTSGRQWVAARDALSTLGAPVLSPDGRFLAVQARGSVFVQPHVLPFGPGVSVSLDSAVHRLAGSMASPGGRMAWSA